MASNLSFVFTSYVKWVIVLQAPTSYNNIYEYFLKVSDTNNAVTS